MSYIQIDERRLPALARVSLAYSMSQDFATVGSGAGVLFDPGSDDYHIEYVFFSNVDSGSNSRSIARWGWYDSAAGWPGANYNAENFRSTGGVLSGGNQDSSGVIPPTRVIGELYVASLGFASQPELDGFVVQFRVDAYLDATDFFGVTLDPLNAVNIDMTVGVVAHRVD